MIISHSHRFILLSINKIATTSSHAILSQFVRDDDVTTGYHDETDQEFIADSKSSPINIPNVTFNEFVRNLEVPVPNWPDCVGGPIKEPNPELEFLFTKYPEEAILNNIAKATFKHSTPVELINWGLITESQLDDYNVYAFVRDPVQRALSSFFFEKYVHKVNTTPEQVVDWIERMNDRGPSVFLGKKYKNYFEYKGKSIAKPLDYAKYDSEISKVVSLYGGEMPTEIPKYKSKCRPEWSKQPLEQWLPRDSIQKLETILREDIEFYNNIRGVL